MTLTVDDLLTPDVEEQILYSARQVARRYRGSAVEDLAQEGRIWVTLHPKRMEHFFNDENAKRGWVRMTRTIEKQMAKTARIEKAAREGYDPDDEYFYALALFDLVMPALWDDDLRQHGPSHDEGDGTRVASKKDPAEGSSWPAMVVDVENAWSRAELDGRQRTMLMLKYRDGATYADIGRAMGVSQSTAHEHVKRALRKLQRQLGGGRPEPCDGSCEDCGGLGSRKVMSNAHARALTDNQYEV